MKVPKSIEELQVCAYHDDRRDITIGYQFLGFKGCFVPDELLRERFAFDGQKVVPEDSIVLTREEAEMCYLAAKIALRLSMPNSQNEVHSSLAMDLLQSKLSANAEAGKWCSTCGGTCKVGEHNYKIVCPACNGSGKRGGER